MSCAEQHGYRRRDRTHAAAVGKKSKDRRGGAHLTHAGGSRNWVGASIRVAERRLSIPLSVITITWFC